MRSPRFLAVSMQKAHDSTDSNIVQYWTRLLQLSYCTMLELSCTMLQVYCTMLQLY